MITIPIIFKQRSGPHFRQSKGTKSFYGAFAIFFFHFLLCLTIFTGTARRFWDELKKKEAFGTDDTLTKLSIWDGVAFQLLYIYVEGL